VVVAPLFLRQAGGHVLTLLDPAGIVLSYNEEGERAECWPSIASGTARPVTRPTRLRPAARADLAAALHEGTLEREAWRVCENGAEVLARLTISALSRRRRIEAACISRDVTDEAAVRASIETREQHLQSILATVPDAMIIIDGRPSRRSARPNACSAIRKPSSSAATSPA
jgi:two-component system sensor kinase FixL